MTRFKNLKTIFLTSILTVGIPLAISQNVFADTLTPKTYTVISGDCLSVIAKAQGISLDNLRKANNNLSDTIFPGQVLTVGATSTPTAQTDKISIKYTASDLDMLARLITAEAQGEPYDAQVAVGAVVVNRVKHNLFPDSISSVINQKTNGNYEFTPVLNGNIEKPATDTAVKAAYEALKGTDPTNNALFFFDGGIPKGLTAPQPVSVVIGHLTFVFLIES